MNDKRHFAFPTEFNQTEIKQNERKKNPFTIEIQSHYIYNLQ